MAWYYGNSGYKTHPVGQKAANELGVFDMSGNVYEWCSDWNGGYTAAPQDNPTGPISSSSHMLRGGSWLNSAQNCRVSLRNDYPPEFRFKAIGFRVASSP